MLTRALDKFLGMKKSRIFQPLPPQMSHPLVQNEEHSCPPTLATS